MEVLIVVLMAELTIKDRFRIFLSRHVGFCSQGVSVHDDMIGLFSLLYVSVFMDFDDVCDVKVVKIPHAYSDHVNNCVSQIVFYYFLLHN